MPDGDATRQPEHLVLYDGDVCLGGGVIAAQSRVTTDVGVAVT